jgi:integrase
MAKPTRLTTKFVEAVRPTPGRQAAYPDVQIAGLELRVSPGGRKVWSFRYRTLEGKQRRMSLGAFPALDLGDARDRAIKVLGSVSDGADPAADTRRAKEAAREREIQTFGDLAEAYFEASEAGTWRPKNKKKRASTIATEKAVLKRHIKPRLGKVELAHLTRRSIRNTLTEMTKAGIGARANKAHAVIRQICAFGIAEELMETNPALGLPQPAEQKARARVLSDDELKTWWNTLQHWPNDLRLPAKDGQAEGDLVTIGRPMRIALQLATLLLQRRGEVAGMALAEVNLNEATWLIPGERTKNGKPHLVPLPARAVELIKEATTLAKAGRKEPPPHVFPSRHKANRPFRPDSLNHAMAAVTSALGIKDVSPHDLRRTGSTALTSERIGVLPFIRSKVLGHTSDSGGGSAVSAAHYDANTYASEKRRALEAWEDLLLEVVGEKPRASKVSAILGGRS